MSITITTITITSTSSTAEAAANTTQKGSFLSPAHYLENQVAVMLWRIWPLCLLVLGGFGNIATVFVMSRLKGGNSSQYAIFMALAVSDLVLLCTAVVKRWVHSVFWIDVSNLHTVACKLVLWMMYASNTISAWLLTCVTVQRTMAVLWPHRMRAMCTVRRTWIVIAALVATACALNAHILYGVDINHYQDCDVVSGEYGQFLNFIYSWVDFCLASIIPAVILFVCDVILSFTLFKAVSSSSSSSSSNTDDRKKMSIRTTVMVVAVSCTFLVLTMPACVFLIWFPYTQEYFSQHPHTLAISVLISAVVFLMWYTNSAINFFLYCLTGTKFRREFLNWIRCRESQTASAPSVSAAEKCQTETHTQRGGHSVLSE